MMAIMYMYRVNPNLTVGMIRRNGSSNMTINYGHSIPAEAAEAGHGGMDYIMMYDLIDAIRNKKTGSNGLL